MNLQKNENKIEELSIIVPVYNGEKTIKRALDSLLNQTLKVHIIVINDGSKDNTESIVLDLIKDNDNIEYYYKDNSGISDTRNLGVDKVKTLYFGFLDSDDYVKPDMAKKMLEAIKKNDSDICFSNFTWVYEDGKRKESKDIGYKDKHEILEKMFNTLWNKIYKTSWFKATGIRFPGGLRYEDTSVLMKLGYYMDKVAYVDESFVDYYQIEGSITRTYNININDMLKVFEGIRDFYIEHKAYDEYKEEIEYLFIRFLLGSSYLRACRIIDNDIRKDTLDKGWNFLMKYVPNYKNNKYVKQAGKKNFYFRHIGKYHYYSNVSLFKLAYKMGILK